jgi:hypothetical protein
LQVSGQTPSKRHRATQQQQQQHHQDDAFTTDKLLLLLTPDGEISRYRSALKLWSDAVGSIKVADLLADPDALMIALDDATSPAADRPLSAETAQKQLHYIKHALLAVKRVHEQQQQQQQKPLLGDVALQQLPEVVRRVTAEKRGYGIIGRDPAAAAMTVTAAATVAAMAAGTDEAEEMLVDGDADSADKAAAAAGTPDRAAAAGTPDRAAAAAGTPNRTAAAGSGYEAADDEGGQHMQIDGNTGFDVDAEADEAALAAAVDGGADAAAAAAAAAASAENGGGMLHAAASGDLNTGAGPAADVGREEEAAAAAAAQGAQAAAALQGKLACRSAVVQLTEQLDPADPAVFETDAYLTGTLLQLVSDSSSLVQLQALQQVLTWLLQEVPGRWRSTC